jgi:hypothetical protein
VSADASLTAEDVQDAFEALLTNIPSVACAAPATPAGPLSAASLAQAIPAAAEHVRELYLLLQPSTEQQQQFDESVGRLVQLKPGDMLVARFWLAYEVRAEMHGAESMNFHASA